MEFSLKTASLNAIQSNPTWRGAPHNRRVSWLYAAAKWCERKSTACRREGMFEEASTLTTEATSLYVASAELRDAGPREADTSAFKSR